MKNGIKVTARLVKQLAEALDGVKDLALLSDEEIAELLDRSEVFENWTEEMREEALGLILQGRIIPGYKATSANTKRKFRNEKAAATLIQEAGSVTNLGAVLSSDAAVQQRAKISISVKKIVMIFP